LHNTIAFQTHLCFGFLNGLPVPLSAVFGRVYHWTTNTLQMRFKYLGEKITWRQQLSKSLQSHTRYLAARANMIFSLLSWFDLIRPLPGWFLMMMKMGRKGALKLRDKVFSLYGTEKHLSDETGDSGPGWDVAFQRRTWNEVEKRGREHFSQHIIGQAGKVRLTSLLHGA
jgi:hypothetical protein